MRRPLVHSLVYTCKASKPLTQGDIQAILQVARQRNPEHGITGKLFYRNGYFLQLLEGEKAKVHALVEAIKRDPRQTNLKILDECEHEQLFDNWSMDFQLLDSSMTMDQVHLPDSPLPPELDQAQIRLRKLLVTFMSRPEHFAENADGQASYSSLVHTLIYTCIARHPMSEAEIQDILRVSRRNNAVKGITGILFYRKNQFLQVLEGEENTVHALVDIIRKDPRQTGLAILEEGKQSRLFGQWAMDFKLLETDVAREDDALKFIPLPQDMSKAQLRLRKLLVSFMNR